MMFRSRVMRDLVCFKVDLEGARSEKTLDKCALRRSCRRRGVAGSCRTLRATARVGTRLPAAKGCKRRTHICMAISRAQVQLANTLEWTGSWSTITSASWWRRVYQGQRYHRREAAKQQRRQRSHSMWSRQCRTCMCAPYMSKHGRTLWVCTRSSASVRQREYPFHDDRLTVVCRGRYIYRALAFDSRASQVRARSSTSTARTVGD